MNKPPDFVIGGRIVHHHGNQHSISFVVMFGLVANIVLVLACYTTLSWIRKNSPRTSNQNVIQKLPPSPPAAAPAILPASAPAIFASKDIDTQNMLLSSANVHFFFQNHDASSRANNRQELILLL